MKSYQHILVALDFGPQSEHILAQALQVAGVYEAQLKVLHVIEPRFMSGAHFAQNNENMEQAKQAAKKNFAVLFATLNITARRSNFTIWRAAKYHHRFLH